MHTKTLKPVSPYQFPADAVYTIVRQITIGGIRFQAGDSLPADSPLRKFSNKLEALVRRRFLAPVVTVLGVTPLPATPEPEAAPVADAADLPEEAGTPTLDISTMSGPQLIRACRERGLPAWGNKDALRKRLRAALAR